MIWCVVATAIGSGAALLDSKMRVYVEVKEPMKINESEKNMMNLNISAVRCPYCGSSQFTQSSTFLKCEFCDSLFFFSHTNDKDIIEYFDESQITDQWEQYTKGFSYEFGVNGVTQNYSIAIKWYLMAAEQGNSWAENRLGDCYKEGKGVLKDYNVAFKWYMLSSKHGDYTGQYNLAMCYYYGHGTSQNYNEAINWLLKAANQNHEWAQYTLGYIYEFGIGITIDYNKAVEWYKKSASLNNSWAQNRLGDCYRYGKGVRKSNREAIRWYKLSASQGDKTAKDNLSQMLR